SPVGALRPTIHTRSRTSPASDNLEMKPFLFFSDPLTLETNIASCRREIAALSGLSKAALAVQACRHSHSVLSARQPEKAHAPIARVKIGKSFPIAIHSPFRTSRAPQERRMGYRQ